MLYLILASFLLCLAISWYYYKCILPYSGFPYVIGLFMVLRNFLTGNIPKNMLPTSFYFQELFQHLKEHESEGLCIVWLMEPKLFIFGEEAIKTFSNEPYAVNKSSEYAILHEFFGYGLITCNGEQWIKKRKMFNPVFHTIMLKTKVDILNRNSISLVKSLMKAENKSCMPLFGHLQLCSFQNMAEFVLGINADDPKKRSYINRLMKLATESSKYVVYRFIHPWLRSRYVLQLSHSGREYLRSLEEGEQIVRKFLMEIKEAVVARNAKEQDDEKDADFINPSPKFFSEIVIEHHLKDPSYTVRDMLFEISTFIFAGYDTVSYALMWCLFTLGHHPEVQDCVYREVESFKDDTISYEDVLSLKYLEAVILETLRLYPIVPAHARRLEKNVQCGKYNVPEGTTLVFFPYLYHRNSNVYPNPEKFDPNRFLDENSRKRPWTHITFSEGIRNCIGKKFALLEMKIILAHVVRCFKVTSLDRMDDVELNWEVILAPVNPLRMCLEPR